MIEIEAILGLPPRARLPLPRPSSARSTSARSRWRSGRRPASPRPGGGPCARARTPPPPACSSAPARCCRRTARARLELLPAIGEALEGTANHTKAGEIYEEALERALAARERRVEGLARLGRAHVWFVAHPEVTATRIVDEAEHAIRLLEHTGEERGLADAFRLLGEARMYEGRASDGQQALEQALEHADPAALPRHWNAISFAMGMCLLDGPAHLERATRFAVEHLAAARRAVDARDGGGHAPRARGRPRAPRALRRGARGARGVDRDQRGHGAALHVAVVQAQPRPSRAGRRRPGRRRARAARELGRADGDGPQQLARRDGRAACRGALRPGPQRRGGGDAARREGRMGGRRRQRQRAPALGARAAARGRGLDRARGGDRRPCAADRATHGLAVPPGGRAARPRGRDAGRGARRRRGRRRGGGGADRRGEGIRRRARACGRPRREAGR